jgi:hypothetical protein
MMDVSLFFEGLQQEDKRDYFYGVGKTARFPCVPFLFRLTQSSGKQS